MKTQQQTQATFISSTTTIFKFNPAPVKEKTALHFLQELHPYWDLI